MEADALTNEDFSAFDAAKRLRAGLLELGFQVIACLMAAAMELDVDIRLATGRRQQAAHTEENQAR